MASGPSRSAVRTSCVNAARQRTTPLPSSRGRVYVAVVFAVKILNLSPAIIGVVFIIMQITAAIGSKFYLYLHEEKDVKPKNIMLVNIFILGLLPVPATVRPLFHACTPWRHFRSTPLSY